MFCIGKQKTPEEKKAIQANKDIESSLEKEKKMIAFKILILVCLSF